VGLVDEKQGMHSASETKAVTLSFVTEEIDGWYRYLLSRGVKMHSPIKNSIRHPTRGFVAYDPEGYYLEFERFLEHRQNAALLRRLMKRGSQEIARAHLTQKHQSLTNEMIIM